MRSTHVVGLAAVLLSGIALPALADWDHIGSVDFSYRNTNDTQYGNFGGPVEALALRAQNSDVTCRDVTATFGDGDRAEIFHGFLPRGRNVAVDLPGRSHLIRRLDFNCHSMDRNGASVEIAADVGRYRAEWRRSPDWDRTWSRMFHWNDNDRQVTGQLDTSGWITLGRERFEGSLDHGKTFGGWWGRNVTSIALRPTDDDARCRNVTVTFANGDRSNLRLGSGDILRENRITMLDLPGNRRDVQRVDMDCHAEHGNMVTMEILASR
ncbi:MAG TPA: hypothetical protein VHT51_18000 [Micropepsaceae bacterium]|jgi:hypothetical protein|nr:hypothetical protein [Micropepsaceae bacterium]